MRMRATATDGLVIGGGIVGLATAYQLGLRRRARVTVLEKEPRLAAHQSGRNSGVIHSGIYYKPGSLKAVNCRAGKQALEEFCARYEVPFERCGKVIVATTKDELDRLDALYERGKANGVQCAMVGQVTDLEPHAAGLRAIHVAETGIVDYRLVCRRLADLVVAQGGRILTNQEVRHCDGDRVVTQDTDYRCSFLVNCAGLHSDTVARMYGLKPDVQIVPFRGEYYRLRDSAARLCRGLIYPVPDPRFPFLGVHFTRMIGGGVECGPNAVLALAREGYSWGKVRWRDLWSLLTNPGVWRIVGRYWRTGVQEMLRSLSRHYYTRSLQRLIPAVRITDLLPREPGVRAQAVSRSGALVDDFLFEKRGSSIHVLNAPSPAATAALNIGKEIAALV
jgi:L-2-hydroxyglutarate oxidase